MGNRTLILVIGADLTSPKLEPVLLGKESERVCRRAVEEAIHVSALSSEAGESSPVIAVTAGMSPRHRCTCMSSLMQDYMHGIFAGLKIDASIASVFNTEGEIVAFLEAHVFPELQKAESIQKIVVVVRWWHSYRTKFLLKHHLKRRQIENKVEVRFLRVESADVAGMIREPVAWIVNIFRITRRILREKHDVAPAH